MLHYVSESYQFVSKMFSAGTVLSKEAVLEHPKDIAAALLMLYLLKFLSGVIVWWTTYTACNGWPILTINLFKNPTSVTFEPLNIAEVLISHRK